MQLLKVKARWEQETRKVKERRIKTGLEGHCLGLGRKCEHFQTSTSRVTELTVFSSFFCNLPIHFLHFKMKQNLPSMFSPPKRNLSKGTRSKSWVLSPLPQWQPSLVPVVLSSLFWVTHYPGH